MNNAEFLLQINKFYQEQQIPISEEGRKILNKLVKHANNHLNEGLDMPPGLELEKHINRLINSVAERLNQVIDAHIEQYKNHVERGLNLNEDQLKNLEFLATVALKFARTGSGHPFAGEETQIKRAGKMLSVYAGGEKFFYRDDVNDYKMQMVIGKVSDCSIPSMTDYAKSQISSRRWRYEKEQEDAKKARAEAPPAYAPPEYRAPPAFNAQAIDNSALYENLKTSIMANANTTRRVINNWTVSTSSNPAHPGAEVIRYEHNNGVAELVMVRQNDCAQLHVQVGELQGDDNRIHLQVCAIKGDLITGLQEIAGENIWMKNGHYGFVSKGMPKALLRTSLTVFAKYFGKVDNAQLPVEDMLQRVPDAGTNVPLVLMARQQVQEGNNNNNNNNNNNINNNIDDDPYLANGCCLQ